MNKYVKLVEDTLKEGFRPSKASKEKKRQQWLAKAEDIAVELNPKKRGNIDWDTAIFLFNDGKTPEEAGKRLSKIKEDTISEAKSKDIWQVMGIPKNQNYVKTFTRPVGWKPKKPNELDKSEFYDKKEAEKFAKYVKDLDATKILVTKKITADPKAQMDLIKGLF
jgi:hypothetical protein